MIKALGFNAGCSKPGWRVWLYYAYGFGFSDLIEQPCPRFHPRCRKSPFERVVIYLHSSIVATLTVLQLHRTVQPMILNPETSQPHLVPRKNQTNTCSRRIKTGSPESEFRVNVDI